MRAIDLVRRGLIKGKIASIASINLLIEGFDTNGGVNSGFDNAGWTVNAGAGCSVDPDFTGLARPDGLAQMCKIVSATTAFDGYIHYLFAENKPIAYTTMYVRFDSATPLTSGDYLDFIKYTDSTAWTKSLRVFLHRAGASLTFGASLYYDGSEHYYAGAEPAAAYDTWYKVQFVYDATAKSAAVKIDGVSFYEVSGWTTSTGGMGYLTIQSSNASSRPWTIYIDGVKVSANVFLD
jgi:hypothetical protein